MNFNEVETYLYSRIKDKIDIGYSAGFSLERDVYKRQKPIFVITHTLSGLEIQFVASNVPPKPVSMIA